MDQLTYGELFIINLALVQLAKHINPESHLGSQIHTAIGKVDRILADISAQNDPPAPE